jgi:hypothetical protein
MYSRSGNVLELFGSIKSNKFEQIKIFHYFTNNELNRASSFSSHFLWALYKIYIFRLFIIMIKRTVKFIQHSINHTNYLLCLINIVLSE